LHTPPALKTLSHGHVNVGRRLPNANQASPNHKYWIIDDHGLHSPDALADKTAI
jgi:hypothetical protein